MNKLLIPMALVALVGVGGCMTRTHEYARNERREAVAGFSEYNINSTVSEAVNSILSLDRIKLQPGANRAVMVIEDVVADTMTRGRDAGPLAEALGQSLREALTNCGKVMVYNKKDAAYATVKVAVQYRLAGKLSERHLRTDDGDIQKEYNLNLTMVDLQTGLEFWQKRIHVGKLVDKANALN